MVKAFINSQEYRAGLDREVKAMRGALISRVGEGHTSPFFFMLEAAQIDSAVAAKVA
jgi:hypothetical protein